MNKSTKNLFFISALLIISALITGTVSGSGSDDVLSYARGDTVTVSGFAAGNPSLGVAVWLFGNNLWDRDVISVDSSGGYSYELSPSETSGLSAGQYYVIVQHPGYNGRFDADKASGVQGQTVVSSEAGSSFIIGGTGSLQGRQAAKALMDMLDSNNIDDMYSYTSFILEEPLIEENLGGKIYDRGIISLSGSTNLAAGEKLFYSVQPLEFGPTSKEYSVPQGGTSGNIYVTGSSPLNLWNAEIDASDYSPGEYIFEIGRPDGSYKSTMVFTVTETTDASEADKENTGTSVQVPAETSVAEKTPDGVPMAQNTPESPLSVLLPIFAAALSVISLAYGKKFL